jgi:hypothetical protein
MLIYDLISVLKVLQVNGQGISPNITLYLDGSGFIYDHKGTPSKVIFEFDNLKQLDQYVGNRLYYKN